MKVPPPPDKPDRIIADLHAVERTIAVDASWPELTGEQRAAWLVACAVFDRLMSQLDDVGRERLALTIRAYVVALSHI